MFKDVAPTSSRWPHLPGLKIPVHEHARGDDDSVALVAKLAVEQISVVAISEIFLSSLKPQLVLESARLQVLAAMCAPVLLYVCGKRG